MKLYGIAGALFTLVIPFFIMSFDAHIETSQSLCPHKLLTGLPCPGCGITKSLIFFYQGDICKSLSYHIFGPFVIFFSIIVIFVLSFEIYTQKEYFNSIFFSKKIAYILAFILGGYHLIRIIYFIATHSFSEILIESIWK